MALLLQSNYNTVKEGSQSKRTLLQKITIQKRQNRTVIENLQMLGEADRAIAIENCGTSLEITDYGEQGERVTAANFCRQRLCIVCASRRQAKFIGQMIPTLEYLAKHGYNSNRYAHVVLTMKNVEGEQLKSAIGSLLNAYRRMSRVKQWGQYVLGAVRSIEVSFNAEFYTYHPHIHMIIIKRKYFPWKTLQSMWREALNIDYNPEVYISEIAEEERSRAAVETLKYCLKYGKVTERPDTLYTVWDALYNRKLVSFSGEFAKARKALKLKNLDDEPLTDEEIKAGNVIAKYICRWDISGGYYEIEEGG